jgi:hypothetical protein
MVRISHMDPSDPLDGSEVVPVLQDGGNARTTTGAIAALAGGITAGADTIPDTETDVQVAHGLGAVPGTVLVTPRSDKHLWVPTRSTTTFTVERAGSSGALNFDWLVTGVAPPPPPQTVEAQGGAGDATSTNTRSVTFAITPAAGDVILVGHGGRASSASTPTGYTKIGEVTYSDRVQTLFAKTSDGTETGVTVVNNGDRCAVHYVIVRGATLTGAVAGQYFYVGTDTNPFSPSITPTDPGRVFYSFGRRDAAALGTHDMQTVHDNRTPITGTTGMRLAIGSRTVTGPGATGDQQMSSVQNNWGVVSIALADTW